MEGRDGGMRVGWTRRDPACSARAVRRHVTRAERRGGHVLGGGRTRLAVLG